MNSTLRELFRRKGIEHQMTIPYTSFQNGAVECAHHTIEERTRCLLIGEKVPPSLWTEAVSCAVYLINRLLVPGRHGDIPYCLWFNTPVFEFSLDHLRVFWMCGVCHVTRSATRQLIGTDSCCRRTCWIRPGP